MVEMTAHLPRLVLGLLATLTLVLSVGGAVGVWTTGAPASRWDQPTAEAGAGPGAPESLRPAAAKVTTRDMEGSNGGSVPAEPSTGTQQAPDSEAVLPADSGAGRRVVFDMSAQRVWLVGPRNGVRRTYLVSGSRTGNLGPGHYEVYSRSRHAVSYTYEETMRFMVRFTTGEQAAIGFHDIPRDQRGRPVQTRDQLGQRLSAGCIRQARPDAIALWRFAGVGTSVVVVR